MLIGRCPMSACKSKHLIGQLQKKRRRHDHQLLLIIRPTINVFFIFLFKIPFFVSAFTQFSGPFPNFFAPVRSIAKEVLPDYLHQLQMVFADRCAIMTC